MAIRSASRRPAMQLGELLEEFDRINAERAVQGLPRVDPFDGLDFSTPAASATDGASFGAFPLRNPPGPQDTLSGGSGNDVLLGGTGADALALLDGMIFDDDPVGSVSFGSLPLRNPPRAPGQAGNRLGTGNVRLPQQPLRQPSAPQQRVSPDDVAIANAETDPNMLFGLSAIPSGVERTRANQLANEEEKAEQAAKREKLRKKFEELGQKSKAVRADQREKSVSFVSPVPESRELPEAVEEVRRLLKRAGVTMPLKRGAPTPDVLDAFLLNEAIGIGGELDVARADRLQRLFPRGRVRFGFDRTGNIVFSLDGRRMTFDRREPSSQEKVDALAPDLSAMFGQLFPGLSPQDFRDRTVDVLTTLATTAVSPLLSFSNNVMLNTADTARMLASPQSAELIGGLSLEEIVDAAVARDDSVGARSPVGVAEPGEDGLFPDFTTALTKAIRRAHARAGGGPLLKSDLDAFSRLGIDTDLIEQRRLGLLRPGEAKRMILAERSKERFAKIRKDQSQRGQSRKIPN